MSTFKLPKGMSRSEAAHTFHQYLSAGRPGTQGPFAKDHDSDEAWQLDPSNDYFLNFSGDEARLTCRYPRQEVTVETMLKLFAIRFFLP